MKAPGPIGIVMRHRLYFWFKGVPADRPGGPWWIEDFDQREDRNRFLTTLRPFLLAHAFLDLPVLPVHDPMDVRPPPEAKVVRHEEEVRWSD